MNYELLPEHRPLIADAFAPFSVDADFIYDHATLDGQKIVIPNYAIKDREQFGKLALYPHWHTDSRGHGFWLLNVNSAKDGCIEFSTKTASFQLKGESTHYAPRPVISEAEEKRRAEVAAKHAEEEKRKAENAAKLIAQHDTAPQELGDFSYMVRKFGDYATLAKSKDQHLKRGDYFGKPALIIPICNELQIGGLTREKQGVQFILEDGSKRIHGAKDGGFHHFGFSTRVKADSAIQVAEGYVTGLTAHLANAKPTVIAFDAGNLSKVMRKFAQQGFRNLEILADNDIHKDDPNKENAGLNAALKAALELTKEFEGLKIKVFIPNLDGEKCDFNDVFVANGLDGKALEIVKSQLADNQAVYFENGKPTKPEKIGKPAFTKKGKPTIKEQALTALEKIELDARYSQLRLQTAKNENKAYWLDRLVDDVTKGLPKYRTPEECVSRLVKAAPFTAVETIRAKVESRYSEKLARVKAKNAPLPADLNGTKKLDIEKDMKEIAEIMKHGKGNIFINLPMGYGKTEFIKSMMESALQDVKTLVVLPRVSLSTSIANAFDISHYKDTGREKFNALHLACVVNSMPDYLRTMPEVAIFDEIRVTLESVIDGGTMKKTQREIFASTQKVIAETRVNVFLDADLNSETMTFCRKHSPTKPCYLITDSRPRKYPLPPVTFKGDCHDNLRIEILDDLKAGKNVFVCSDSKAEPKKTKAFLHDDFIFEADKNADKELKKMANYLRSHGVKRLLLVTQDTKDDDDVKAFLADQNNESKQYCCVLVSPTIQVGFSIANGHFHKTYGLMGSGSCSSNEVVQSLYRVRDVEEIVLSIKEKRNSDEIEHIPTATMRINGHFEIQRALNPEELREFAKDDELALLYYEQAEARAKDKADLANNILLHLENVGFSVTHNRPNEIKTLKDLSEKVKQQDFEAITDLQIKSVSTEFAKELEKKKQSHGLKSWESMTLFRHYVEVFAGLVGFTDLQAQQLNDLRQRGNDPLTREIFDDYSKLLKQVTAYEKTLVDREELVQIDEENYRVRIAKREIVERDLFDDLVDAIKEHGKHQEKKNKAQTVIVAESDCAISTSEAAEICDEILKPRANILAANGHTNYARNLPKPIQVLKNIFVRHGYDLKAFRRDGTENRVTWYTLELNAKVKHYADCRAENRKRAPQATYQTSTLNP